MTISENYPLLSVIQRGFIFLLGLICLGIVGCAFQSRSDWSDASVILITIDTLRADRLGAYGYKRNTSPNIDEFSKKAVLFNNAITPCPKSLPSTTSMLTGLYPHTHGIRTNLDPLKSEVTTLAEILRQKNYKTAAFVSSWIIRSYLNLNQGFDLYDDKMSDPELNRPDIFERKAPLTTRAATNWLENNYQDKFFLWVHYQDPHGPYVAPQEYRKLFTHTKKDLIPQDSYLDYQKLPWLKVENGLVDANAFRDAYDAEIRFCDEYVGKLLSKIDSLNLKKVIIILTADHGESLGEHFYYFEHGNFVYDVSSRVPLLIYADGIRKGKRIEQQVNLMNVTPTILDMLGFEVPPFMEGNSLSPLLRGKQYTADQHIIIEKANKIKAVRTNDWKFIRNFETNKVKLYNLKQDPYEKVNVIKENIDKARELDRVLNSWLTDSDKTNIKELKDRALKDEERKALRSLGYLH